ncbi:TonB-dependent receptor plug domain-containing protein [Verrucomicrobium spinosum]|uniref:TonB-dependent receptor plug domain-containing protein n=1 Tax=Verrucomicrobium spinosum TaxID=2736 RepID=UPI000174697E|nr:TonB-dependent receptor [Verrucomicrobium spinosum]
MHPTSLKRPSLAGKSCHAAIAACLLCATLAPAQNPSPATGSLAEEVELPTVTVTAETALRTTEDLRNIPQSVTVVDKETLERRQARTPVEMLQEEPGVWAVSVAAQGSPILRGQIGNRVLYLWDGIRINNGALFGGPNGFFNQFPVGAVDHMEVIRGAGAVQYGSDAIGGVINIFSKRADFTDTVQTGGELYGRYGTNDRENTETFDFHVTGPTMAFSAGLTHQDVDDYRGPGEGRLSPTGFEALGGYANLAFRPAEGHTFRLSWIHNEREDVDSYVQSKLNANGVPRLFSPTERRGIVKFDYTAEDLGSWSQELKVYGYYQYYDGVRDRRVQSGSTMTTTRTDTEQDVLGAGIQNAAQWGRTRLIYGMDYRREDLGSTLTQTTRRPGSTTVAEPFGNTPDGNYDVFDAFTTLEFRPTDALLLSVGARFENSHLDSGPVARDVIPDAGYDVDDLRVDKSWQSVTWNIGAIYSLNKEWDLVANIGSGFRAPTYSDLLSAGPPVFSSRVASLPSPDLDPEKSISYEVGPRFHSQRTSASLVGYWTQLYDLVATETSGTVVIPGQGTFEAQRKSNNGEGYVAGVEFALTYDLDDNWTLFGNATYTYGEDTNANAPLRFMPPLYGVVGLRYTAPSRRWWVEVVEVLADRLRRHAPTDEQDAGFSTDPAYGSPNSSNNPPLRDDYEIPGWAVTNVRTGFNIWQRDNRSFDVTVDFNNVFDTRYREAYSQQQKVAPGFGVVVGARLTF